VSSIANVIMQSGSTVPEWVSKLPKPSKIKRRLMGRAVKCEVNSAVKIGKAQAIKKRCECASLTPFANLILLSSRDMVTGSKRRKDGTGEYATCEENTYKLNTEAFAHFN
jgi:hypothetical protein